MTPFCTGDVTTLPLAPLGECIREIVRADEEDDSASQFLVEGRSQGTQSAFESSNTSREHRQSDEADRGRAQAQSGNSRHWPRPRSLGFRLSRPGASYPFQFFSRSDHYHGVGAFLLPPLLCSVGASGWDAGRTRLDERQFSRFTAGLRSKVRESHSDQFEHPSAAGTRNGSGRGRFHAARALFGSPISIDRLPSAQRKSAHLIFTVTVRPREFAFSHHAQTSLAIAITPASI